jgi:hypothetical protein
MAPSYASQSSGNLRDDGNFTAAGKGQVCIPTADKNLQFKKLKAVTANQVCFDCPATRPTWASVTYGRLAVYRSFCNDIDICILMDVCHSLPFLFL